MDLLVRGDIPGACAMNPAALIGVLFFAALALYACGILILRWEPLRPAVLRGNVWRFALAALLGANWIYLLVSGRV